MWLGAKRKLFTAAVLWVGLQATASAEVLLFDDFSGTALNSQLWDEATWHLGRTQFGNALTFAQEGTTDYLSMSLDTYNPNEPGASLYGAEIYSVASFPVDTGLEFEARVRSSVVTPGLVSSLFLYAQDSQGWADEIDVEVLSAQPSDSFLATSWNNWGDPNGSYNDGVFHAGTQLSLASYDYTAWQTYTIRWFSDRVEWYLNGTLVKQTDSPVPDLAMSIRSNFWAADSNWSQAYGPALMATSDSSLNQHYRYDLDYIKVSRINSSAVVDVPLNALEVSRVTTSSWSSGYCEKVTVQNPDSRSRDWTIDLLVNGTLSNAWSANVQMLEEGVLQAQGFGLTAGASTSFGYCIKKPVRQVSNSELIITRDVFADWGSGYCEKITVKNPNDILAIWTVSLPIEGVISTYWSSNMVQTGGQVEITGLTWNERLNPLSSTKVGFCAKR
ncbi:MAG: cellulose binding domain-containing protein [Gammaproteobacteria bacterium]|nr:cellulose binding domain-containing protein [Gammaproteobacteria bacterium]